MQFTQPVSEIITRRKSVRTYAEDAIDADKARLLSQWVAEKNTGPFGSHIRMQFIAANPYDASALKGLGTYGNVKHPQGFLVGAVEHADKYLEDFGHVIEQSVLLATDLGLATCWLGGGFRQSSFAQRIVAKPNEEVPAVISVGLAADKPRLLESLLRIGAGSDKRFPWEKLFFSQHFATPLAKEDAGRYAVPLEMLRLGPSASNKQPWRVVKDAGTNRFHLYLQRTPGYNRSQKKIMRIADLQRVDMGIALCHFELSAQERGLRGKWLAQDPKIAPLPDMTEYVATWVEA